MQAKPSYFNSIKVSKLDTAHAIPQPQIESKITTACSSNDSDSELKLARKESDKCQGCGMKFKTRGES